MAYGVWLDTISTSLLIALLNGILTVRRVQPPSDLNQLRVVILRVGEDVPNGWAHRSNACSMAARLSFATSALL
jgi:hypothetical protein